MKAKKNKQEKIETKQRITELQKQKKAMEKELDDLHGRTAKGKVMAILACLLIICLVLGSLVAMVKFNAGGVADNVLGPVIGDVPVARSILPKRLQKKNASEIAAEKKAKADAKAAQKAQKDAAQKAAAEAKATAEAQKKAEASAAAAAKKQARADAKATAAAEKAANLQDYVDTYANMDPQQAATIFNNMMSDHLRLVAKILKNMQASKRANILANMDTLSAAQVTSVMAEMK